VVWKPDQLLSPPHLSSLPSSQPNVLPPSTRRTSGHCLGTFISLNLALFRPVKIVSRSTQPLSLLSLASFKGLILNYIESSWKWTVIVHFREIS
jgi:hypothetical protein